MPISGAASWALAMMKSAAIQGVLSPFLVRERLAAGVVFNPFTRSFREDPYPLYARLREQDPVHHSPLLDGYVLTRYEHVEAMLRDPRTSSNSWMDGACRSCWAR